MLFSQVASRDNSSPLTPYDFTFNNLPSYQTLTNAFKMFEKETPLPSTVELISKAV